MSLPETFYQNRNMYFADVYSRGMQMVPSFPIQGRYWFVKGGSGAAADDGTGGDDAGDALDDGPLRCGVQVLQRQRPDRL